MNNDELARRLAFVAPERRALVDRRLALLKAYVALDQPTMEHSRAAATEMGLTTAGFYRLVSVWRRTRDPAVLDGTAGPAPGPQSSRFDDEAFIREVFDGMLSGRTVEHDVENVLLAAERAGRKIRGRSTLRRFVTELRAAREAAGSTLTGVLIDHAVLVMPVAGPHGAPVMPVATAVVSADVGRRSILAVHLTLEAVGPATILAALGHAAARGVFMVDPLPPTDLAYMRGTGAEWDEAEALLNGIGVRVGGGRSKTIRGGFGGATTGYSLLGIKTRPGIVALPPDRRGVRPRKGDDVLSLTAAQGMIDERVAFESDGSTPFSKDPTALLRFDR